MITFRILLKICQTRTFGTLKALMGKESVIPTRANAPPSEGPSRVMPIDLGVIKEVHHHSTEPMSTEAERARYSEQSNLVLDEVVDQFGHRPGVDVGYNEAFGP